MLNLTQINFKTLYSVGIPFFFSLGLLCLYFPPEFTTDSAHYFWGARSLLHGTGYQTYNPVAPGLVPIISWPPLFSSLIAFFQKTLSLHEINAFKATNFLAFSIYGASCLWLSQILFKTDRFKLFSLFFFSIPIIWQYLNFIMSEMLFMGLLMLALTLYLAALETQTKFKRITRLGCAGLAVLLLGLTRYSGMVAVLPLGLCLIITSAKQESLLRRAGELTVFLFPAAVGLSLFLLRNKMAVGQFTYLETYHKWPLKPQTFNFVANFAQGLFESIAGYHFAALNGHPAGLLPPAIFLILTGIVFGTIFRSAPPQLKDPRKTFILITLIFLTFYLGEMYVLKLKKGFGDSPRYFHVIAPLIYLSCLSAIEWLLERKSSTPQISKKNSLMISGLALFLLVVIGFKSFDSLKSVFNTTRRTAQESSKIYMTDFGQSPWIYAKINEIVSANDLVISNNAAALSYITGHQVLEYRALHRNNLDTAQQSHIPSTISDRLQSHSGSVYIAIEKKYAFRPGSAPNWHEYLDLYRYEIIQEDDFAVLARLKIA